MASATVAELDGLLAELNSLKPPGASKTKIAAITSLCVNNIQAEFSTVQSFYGALKKAPATHKLGVLYVIDSVVRQWIEKAKAAGQSLLVEGKGEPGTYPAAVKRTTELLPTLFEATLKEIPADQKPKLENLVTIWERGHTFPAKTLANFKAKFSGAQKPALKEQTTSFPAPIPTRPMYTPVGYPPQQLYDQGLVAGQPGAPKPNGAVHGPSQSLSGQPVQSSSAAPAGGPPADVNSILAALSRAAPPAQAPAFPPPVQPAPQAPAMPAQLPPEIAALFNQQVAGQPAPGQPAQPTPFSFPNPQQPPQSNFQPPNPYAAYPPQPPPSVPQAYAVAPPPQQAQPPPQQSDPLAPLRGLLPANILNDHQKLIPALQLLQDLQKEGIPPERWGPVLQAFEEQFKPAPSAGYGGQPDANRVQARSRSPDRNGGRGRGSPVYGAYDGNSGRGQGDDMRGGRNGGGRGNYRQRSPVRNNPGTFAMNGKPMQPKMIDFDPNLPANHIKVLSRTLFVGGANGSQQEIQDLFERFGAVQTCIANRDKRHAFVKMTTRNYAMAARAGMEELQSRNDREVMNIARQTKWGVGFGPRECCDYAAGESTIPIHKLTEADMKWLLTAEYGGTGGKPVEGGMVLEEPDIEIGAGVSSKAMSKRVGPDHTPQHAKRQREDRGGRHGKHKGGDHGYGGGYSGVSGNHAPMESYGYARPEPVAVATPPAVPGFGFSLGLPPANGQGGYR